MHTHNFAYNLRVQPAFLKCCCYLLSNTILIFFHLWPKSHHGSFLQFQVLTPYNLGPSLISQCPSLGLPNMNPVLCGRVLQRQQYQKEETWLGVPRILNLKLEYTSESPRGLLQHTFGPLLSMSDAAGPGQGQKMCKLSIDVDAAGSRNPTLRTTGLGER